MLPLHEGPPPNWEGLGGGLGAGPEEIVLRKCEERQLNRRNSQRSEPGGRKCAEPAGDVGQGRPATCMSPGSRLRGLSCGSCTLPGAWAGRTSHVGGLADTRVPGTGVCGRGRHMSQLQLCPVTISPAWTKMQNANSHRNPVRCCVGTQEGNAGHGRPTSQGGASGPRPSRFREPVTPGARLVFASARHPWVPAGCWWWRARTPIGSPGSVWHLQV